MDTLRASDRLPTQGTAAGTCRQARVSRWERATEGEACGAVSGSGALGQEALAGRAGLSSHVLVRVRPESTFAGSTAL